MGIRAKTGVRSQLASEHGRHTAHAARSLLILVCAGQLAACAHFQAKPLSAGASIAAFDSRSLEAPGLRAFLAANHLAPPAPGAAWSLKALTLQRSIISRRSPRPA